MCTYVSLYALFTHYITFSVDHNWRMHRRLQLIRAARCIILNLKFLTYKCDSELWEKEAQ